jgi:hypothetical protein
LAWNLTRSPQWTHSALLPASIDRITARLVNPGAFVVEVLAGAMQTYRQVVHGN